MNKPVKSGRELLDEIDSADCPTPRLWWLGHSGFVVKCQGIIFYIDPYLSDSDGSHARMTASPLRPEDVAHADLILCTHEHCDHLDPGALPAMLRASRRAKLVLPKSLTEHAHRFGVPYERMTTTDSGLRIEYFKGFHYGRVYSVPSAHDSLDWSPLGGYPRLGYLLRFGSCTIYHAGDCIPYPDLVERLRPYNVTAALLPISGRNSVNDLPGNFNIVEAAQLAEDIGARWLVPMHYGMFAHNTVDVDRFVDHMLFHRPSQRFKVFQCGEGWAIPLGD